MQIQIFEKAIGVFLNEIIEFKILKSFDFMNSGLSQTNVLYFQGAHTKGVTAIALLNDGLFTGGQDGQLRTWRTSRFYPNAKPKLLATLKEHTASVVSLNICQDEVEAISASADGSCIIWDISK